MIINGLLDVLQCLSVAMIFHKIPEQYFKIKNLIQIFIFINYNFLLFS